MPRDTPSSPFSEMRKEEERKQKRDWLLHAAVKMFNAQGFHETSLDDVAASVKVSKPTIYFYLGNKDQVLLECVKRGLEDLRRAAEYASNSGGSGLDRLRTYLRLYAEIAMQDFGACVILTNHRALSPGSAEQLLALKRDVDSGMRRFIEDAIADGSIAPVDVKLTAFAMAGTLSWPARWFDEDGPVPADKIASHAVDLLTSGLAPR